jgi:hypothetical protein
MRLLTSLLRLTRLDRQRNPDVHNRLRVDNKVEGIQLYQRNWINHLEGMDRRHLPDEVGFVVPTSGTAGFGNTKTKMARPRTP